MEQDFWAGFALDPRTHTDMRAGDLDRLRVTDLLSAAYADGRLDAEEFYTRTEDVNHAKTLGDLVAHVDDLVPTTPEESTPRDEVARRLALAKLTEDRVPITPEQIDEAARKYYVNRVRKAVFGTFAGPAGLCLAIWAVSSVASGTLVFFWPIFVIIPTLLGMFGQIAHKTEIIESKKKELTTRARAELGDETARQELEHTRPADDPDRDFGPRHQGRPNRPHRHGRHDHGPGHGASDDRA